MNNKVRGDMQFVCVFIHICRKFEFLISQDSVATCLRWGGYCGMTLVANFVRFPAVETFWKSVKVWQSYRQFKCGSFYEALCSIAMELCRPLGGQRVCYFCVYLLCVSHPFERWSCVMLSPSSRLSLETASMSLDRRRFAGVGACSTLYLKH